jgi:cytochrome P450
LLTILIQNEFFAGDEEKIIDEAIGLLLAGMITVQLTMTNLICYCEKYPEVKLKL